eukprot:scaffold56310_cov54-Attheya_sp.AAC.2
MGVTICIWNSGFILWGVTAVRDVRMSQKSGNTTYGLPRQMKFMNTAGGNSQAVWTQICSTIIASGNCAIA